MKKDKDLLAVIDQLRGDVGFDLVIVDHWDDFMATGVARPGDQRTLVYIAVWADGISFECERPPSSLKFPYDTDGMVDGADYPELLAAVQGHLTLPKGTDS